MPEIALTTQITERLQRVFGSRLGIYHSKFPDAERVEIWQKQLSGSGYDIILGVRSSVFLPFRKLGLVIVDEEHENTYKQQDPAPRYHARNAATVLAALYGAKTLLGTATPSIETWHNAMSGKYGLVELKERYKEIQLPEIIPVDIKELQRKKRMNGPFSPLLLQYVREALERKEQVILFQNRRGFAPMIECHTCGWVPKCKNCDVSLTYHKGLNQLTCHYCGYTYQLPRICPACEGTDLRNRGFGTEKIEDDVKLLFPEATVARMDLDTTRTRAAYERIIADFEQGKTDILIGTQMVAKGLDFENVTLVGVITADTMLNINDYRSGERTFAMLEQVSGRAGRGSKEGRAVIQTYTPEHEAVSLVKSHNYRTFYDKEIAKRKLMWYPPFCKIVSVHFQGNVENIVAKTAKYFLNTAEKTQNISQKIQVLGPVPSYISKIKNKYRWQIIFKCEDDDNLGEILSQAEMTCRKNKEFSDVAIIIDKSPGMIN